MSKAGVRGGRPGPTPRALVERGAPQWYKTSTIYKGKGAYLFTRQSGTVNEPMRVN